jgi:hypothetical protein
VDRLFRLQHEPAEQGQQFLVELVVVGVGVPLLLDEVEVGLRVVDRRLLLDDRLLPDGVALAAEVDLAGVADLDLAETLLSEGLGGTGSTSMREERAGSPPLRSSTISVMVSSLPLEILKLQNLMFCSIWSIFSRKTFSLSESLTCPMS